MSSIPTDLLGRWKLGPKTWVEVTVAGPFGRSELSKLRRYVDMLEADPPTAPPSIKPDTAKEGT
jgi:hypothetical protein